MSSVAMKKKGSQIEACPEGDGFKGAWYRAILEAIPKKPARKFTVKFLDLEDEDGSSLIETAFQKFLRPIPPEDLFSEDEFEEGCLVEAKFRDAWWVGVFVKKLEDKYLVYFDSPPELICFEREQLRQHFEWSNNVKKWVKPQNKKLRKETSFSCGTIVEVMEERNDVVWVEAIVVKEMEAEESFLVKSCKNLSSDEEMKPKRKVSLARIRCVPPSFEVESYMLMEPVEVFMEPGWRPGLVTEILCEKHYKVKITATKDVLVFKHSELRPSAESRRFRGFVQKCSKDNAATTSERPPSPVENVEAVIDNEDEPVATMELPSSQALGTKVGCSAMNSNTTSLTKEAVPPATLSLSIAVTTTKQTENIVQGMTSHNELIREKAQMPTVHNNENGNRKRKRGEPEDNSNLNETVLTSDQTANSAANVEETNAEDTIMVLPFVKKSPAWKIYETMEVPQNPHFTPLLEESEDFREGSALGLIMSYSGLLERLKGLKTDVPISQLDCFRVSFTKLEKHGFNVTMMLSRINTLVALKNRQLTISEELNGFDREKAEAKEEYEEAKRKIHELQKQKEAAYKKMCQIESSARDLNKELMNVENQFEKTLSTPW